MDGFVLRIFGVLSQYSLDLDSGASVIGVMEGECGQGMWDWVPVGSCGCCKGMMGLLASSHVNISLYFKLIYLLLAGLSLSLSVRGVLVRSRVNRPASVYLSIRTATPPRESTSPLVGNGHEPSKRLAPGQG